MSRRTPQELRCLECEIHKQMCFCDQVPRLELATRVGVLMHRRERKLTSNTARLARRVLPNLEIREWGGPEGYPQVHDWVSQPGVQPAVLYPAEDSFELGTQDQSWNPEQKPVFLIVPDGNWGQAGKVHRRILGLEGVPRVRLPIDLPSRYRLRKTEREGCVSTYEAIARALALIEKNPEIRAQMEKFLDVMVERRLLQRGQLHPSELKYWDGVWGRWSAEDWPKEKPAEKKE